MCPDRQILSALHDCEIPSPWQEKIQEHVAECEKCRDQINSYHEISRRLHHDPPGLKESQERVWQKITAREGMSTPVPLWKRRVSIPAPLMAAAVFAVIVGFTVFSIIPGKQAPSGNTPEVWTVQFENHDLEDLAELLKNRDSQVQVFIELPPSSPMGLQGEPQLLRAADYRKE